MEVADSIEAFLSIRLHGVMTEDADLHMHPSEVFC
jgi:hypothetical protein